MCASTGNYVRRHVPGMPTFFIQQDDKAMRIEYIEYTPGRRPYWTGDSDTHDFMQKQRRRHASMCLLLSIRSVSSCIFVCAVCHLAGLGAMHCMVWLCACGLFMPTPGAR
jgi:hypothetical protein